MGHEKGCEVWIPAPVQVGEALQIHSGGLLKATPHYVKAASGTRRVGISRNTLAVFMQPDVLEPLDCPSGMSARLR